jgi:probable dihydroxyacetone kinase regulator
MCNNTKEKIAAALRQLMAERPFQKITVRDLMDATNMKRQSFYYHFQDTRDVLMWICRQSFLEPVRDCPGDLTEQMLFALTLIDRDRSFYRRMLGAIRPDFIRALEEQILRPRMCRLLYGDNQWQQLSTEEQFVVDFTAHAASDRLIQFAESRRPLDENTVRKKIHCLLNTLHISEENRKKD